MGAINSPVTLYPQIVLFISQHRTRQRNTSEREAEMANKASYARFLRPLTCAFAMFTARVSGRNKRKKLFCCCCCCCQRYAAPSFLHARCEAKPLYPCSAAGVSKNSIIVIAVYSSAHELIGVFLILVFILVCTSENRKHGVTPKNKRASER